MGPIPQPWKQPLDGVLAIVWVLFSQFLMMALEEAMVSSPFPFPASILAMMLVFTVLLVVGYAWDGLPEFYDAYLRDPADLLNRHMSIGFSVPIVLLCRMPMAPARTIGLIIAAFLIAGCIATTTVYFVAWGLQTLLTRCAGLLASTRQLWERRRRRPCDEESQDGPRRAGQEGTKGFLSESSSMASTQGDDDDDDSRYGSRRVDASAREEHASLSPPPPPLQPPTETPTPSSATCRLLALALRNPFAVLSWLALVVVGVPLRFSIGSDVFLAVSLLFALWFSVIAAQRRVKSLPCLETRPRIRVCLAAALNPVLWTALGMIAYVYAESAASRRPIPEVLDLLQQNTTLTDLVLHRTSAPAQPAAIPSTFSHRDLGQRSVSSTLLTSSPSSPPSLTLLLPRSGSRGTGVGPGDIALAILYAGLVSWGLKLWQYRRRLASRAGATILAVSALAALLNVALGPPLARAVGLADDDDDNNGPAYDLAFAARTATLALGGPALSRLGGDLGLNAALVVANGIVFQMGLGLGIGARLSAALDRVSIFLARCARFSSSPSFPSSSGVTLRLGAVNSHPSLSESTTTDNTSASATTAMTTATGRETESRGPSPRPMHRNGNAAGDEARTVAAGVTIGINAAAMGTAHLYEVRSDAAPYAALSMTVFGVATVGFTLVPPLAAWVVGRVSP